MGKINILDASVFNMLAAGEVVERPASVVKELVENSIDAGATVIDITIEEGGTRLIEVSDNGVGIAREDMRAAFLPHATSKIKQILDLDSLSTLGFRGEALASIASVSEVTAISAQRGADVASKLVLSGGKVTCEGGIGRSEGTSITVENLFFNTPARIKFLKKPSLEQKYIEDTVRNLILANPELSISLYADGERVLSHGGSNLFDAIVAVYGAKNADCLIPIQNYEYGGIRVTGFVSSPDRTKSTRAYESAIVNGRCVLDQTVQTAAEKAYGDLLMKRCFPIFVLNIVVPFDQVDVNVHPSKTEVRFANRQAVFGAVYHAVYDAVHASHTALPTANETDKGQTEHYSSSAPVIRPQTPRVVQPRIDSSKYYATPPKSASVFRESAIPAYADVDVPFVSEQEGLEESAPQIEPSREDDAPVFDGKIVGQIFATYLVVERDDVVYIIDQHAAHERVLYDKIYARTVPEFVQPLLIPYTLFLSGDEAEKFETLIDPLKSIGFEFSKSGANYVIEAVPEPIARINFRKFFSELFAEELPSDKISLAELMRESLCQQACKAAIKGGETLSRQQIERVLSTLSDENGELPSKCPHGRPAVITLTKTDIEKLFKRIV